MWRSLNGIIIGIILSALPVQAQVPNTHVEALVEALRQAAPKTQTKNDGLYSDWQILPGNIPRWSKSCIGRELSPGQFESSPATARGIVVCVMGDVLRDQYRISGKNESIAVRRAAAWWMTGDANRFASGQTASYTQKVLSLYQKQLRSESTVRPEPQQTSYDRYMQVGYDAVQKKDYQTALINFKRARQERPEDIYAKQAVLNVEKYIQQSRSATPTTSQAASSASAASITQPQALDLIKRWLQAKSQIFAPPFDHQSVVEMTTGELYTDLDKADGAIAWLKQNNAYYRFGVQKVESVARFVAAGNKATIEVNITEDRTLYRDGKVDPNQTAFNTNLIRYSLVSVDDKWKIADYKTVDGSLIERAVLH
jgi:hypothetical protein